MSEQHNTLAGRRILVTRTREQASVLSQQLQALGALPIEFPTIRIVPPREWHELDSALERLYRGGYDWLILTSANGVRICMQRLRDLGYEPASLRGTRIATIGPATAATLESYGLRADLVPAEYIAEGILAALCEGKEQLAGQRMLLARAAEARKVLTSELRAAGALVDDIAAYYTVTAAHDDEQGHVVLDLLQHHQLEILTFTSSSTVRNFSVWLESCGEAATALVTGSPRLKIASIGPITSRTARELGLRVDIEAQEFTIEGLVKAIIEDSEEML